MPRPLRCENCGAPLHADGPQALVTCSYCGFQSLLDATSAAPAASPDLHTRAGGPHTDETIWLKASPTRVLPLIERGVALPTSHTTLLSTARDAQESLRIELLHGNAADSAAHAVLADITLPLVQRAPRGVSQVVFTVEVDEQGAVSVTVGEKGARNSTRRDGLRIRTAG